MKKVRKGLDSRSELGGAITCGAESIVGAARVKKSSLRDPKRNTTLVGMNPPKGIIMVGKRLNGTRRRRGIKEPKQR